jgi:HEAT repeat protein
MPPACRIAALLLAASLPALSGCMKGTQGLGMRTDKPSAADIARAQQVAPAAAGMPLLSAGFSLPPIRQETLQETAATALARIGPEAIPALVQALRDADPQVRSQAALALARMGPDASPAVPALMEALSDRDENVRRCAARALGQVGPSARAAIPALITALRQRPT